MRIEHLSPDDTPHQTSSKKTNRARNEISKIACEGDVKNKSLRESKKLRERSVSYQKEKKDEIIVTPVNQEIKEKILNWLYDLTMLKDNLKSLDKKLPKICKNGLIFIDLINRLESKHDTLKGINRNPKNKSYINSNFSKLMEYLKSFEKMNPRYLQAIEYLVEGNEDVFWGFFDDIWHLYNKKVSPFDPRFKKEPKSNTSKSRLDNSKFDSSNLMEKSYKSAAEEISYSDILYHDRSKTQNSLSPVSQTKRPNLDSSAFKSKESAKENLHKTPIREPEREVKEEKSVMFKNHSYTELRNKKPHFSSTPTAKSSLTKRNDSLNPSPLIPNKSQSRIQTEREILISIEQESEIMEWLKILGLKTLMMRKSEKLFGDPFRNGTLLCYVVSRVYNEKLNGVYQDPKSIDECRFNIYKALGILR